MVDSHEPTHQATAALLFGLVWETMVDLIGTAATATLMRRSIKRAAERCDDIEGLTVRRDGFEYTYRLPDVWQLPGDASISALRQLIHELCPLLVELSGPVVIRRLRSVELLQHHSILFQEHSK